MREYDVVFFAYCGMTCRVADGVSLTDAKAALRRRLGAARRLGRHVTRIGRHEWECQTPDDAGMVGDFDGTLVLRAARRARRR